MAKFIYDDLSFTKQLDFFDKSFDVYKGEALYEGAGIIADSIKSEIDNIPDSCILNDRERDDLKRGMCISRHMNYDGSIIAYIDFTGYNEFVLNGEAKGEPVRLIARAICKGTPKMRKGKYNFVKKGFDKAVKEAEEAMKKKIEDGLNQSV